MGKELLKENSNVIFLTVIDTTLHFIINILFSGAKISAIQLLIGKNPFEFGKKTLIWYWEWGLISAP